MTDEEIKEVVANYITDTVESDDADGLSEQEAFSLSKDPWFDEPSFNRALAFYHKAKVTVTFDD